MLKVTPLSFTVPGKSTPGRKIIEKICSAYNIDPREFFETDKNAVVKKSDPLIEELQKLPEKKKDLILKINETIKDMDTEDIREILKHSEKEKYWKQHLKRKRKAG